MVAASGSPRPDGVDDSTLGVAHPSRGRAHGGRGQPRPLGPARPVRRPRLHGSSSDVGASGDLPGESSRRSSRGSIRGHPVRASRAAVHVDPSNQGLGAALRSSLSAAPARPCVAASYSSGSRPPALPALIADERL